MANNAPIRPGRRAAIVGGLRTPFVKSGSDFKALAAIDLAALVVNELVARSGIAPEEFDLVTFGEVVPSTTATVIRKATARIARAKAFIRTRARCKWSRATPDGSRTWFRSAWRA